MPPEPNPLLRVAVLGSCTVSLIQNAIRPMASQTTAQAKAVKRLPNQEPIRPASP